MTMFAVRAQAQERAKGLYYRRAAVGLLFEREVLHRRGLIPPSRGSRICVASISDRTSWKARYLKVPGKPHPIIQQAQIVQQRLIGNEPQDEVCEDVA